MTMSVRMAAAAFFSLTTLCHVRAAEYSIEQIEATLKGSSSQSPADFAGKDLSDLDLSRFGFRNANVRDANFFASRLIQADFRGAHLEGANLNGAWLMGTNFAGAHMAQASLLSVVVLGGQVKQTPIFEGADLTGAKMIADLPGATLRMPRSESTSRTRAWVRCAPTCPTPTSPAPTSWAPISIAR